MDQVAKRISDMVGQFIDAGAMVTNPVLHDIWFLTYQKFIFTSFDIWFFASNWKIEYVCD